MPVARSDPFKFASSISELQYKIHNSKVPRRHLLNCAVEKGKSSASDSRKNRLTIATRQVFSEIKQALGLPVLRVFFPALAVYPQFLQLHWKMLRPMVSSAEFFACADRLRADADTRAHNYLRIPDLCSRLAESLRRRRRPGTGRPHWTCFTTPIHCCCSCFRAQMQALEGPVGEGANNRQPGFASHVC